MNCKVTFEAKMSEDDINAMYEFFYLAMERELHIDCHDLKILTTQN